MLIDKENQCVIIRWEACCICPNQFGVGTSGECRFPCYSKARRRGEETTVIKAEKKLLTVEHWSTVFSTETELLLGSVVLTVTDECFVEVMNGLCFSLAFVNFRRLWKETNEKRRRKMLRFVRTRATFDFLSEKIYRRFIAFDSRPLRNKNPVSSKFLDCNRANCPDMSHKHKVKNPFKGICEEKLSRKRGEGGEKRCVYGPLERPGGKQSFLSSTFAM